MSDTIDSVVNLLIVAAVGAAIQWQAPGWLALYSLIVTAGLIIHLGGRLWTLVKVSHAITNATLLVVAKQLGASEADYDAAIAEARRRHPFAWKAFDRDLQKL